MKINKYLAALIAFSLLLAVPVIVGAQDEYSDTIIDEEGDVFHWHSTGWDYNVERPNIDIIRAELSESDGIVTISLTVKGEITADENISYIVYMDDDEDGFYYYVYSDDYISMLASNDRGYRSFEPDVTGIGSDTLIVSCSLEDLLEPPMLRFESIITWEYTDDGYYQDTASPKDAEFLPFDYELEVEPTMGEAPLEVEITVSAENTGDASGQIPVTVNGETIHIMELGGQERAESYTVHTFEEPGTYTVEFGDQSRTVLVQDESDEDPIIEPYSDMITDPEGNVMRLVGPTEDDWEYVESPDVDIIKVEISESGGIVTVSLTVKGTIRDHQDIYYEIYLKDDTGEGEFEIYYNNGDAQMSAYLGYGSGAFGNNFVPSVDGVGTSTLNVHFTRDQIGHPDVLLISWVIAMNEEYPEADMAGPDAIYPGEENGTPPDDDDDVAPPDDDNGDVTDDDDDVFDEEIEGLFADLFARGMMLLLLMIVLPIAVVIIIIVVLIKVVRKEDKEHKSPQSIPPKKIDKKSTPPPPKD